MQRLSAHSSVFMSNYEDPKLKKLLKGFDWHSFPVQGTLQKKNSKETKREILFYKIHPSIRE
jgi:hypothetical protein